MTIQAALRRVLALSALLALAIALVGGVIGFVVAGWPGVWSALAGSVVAVAFCSLTALSIIVGFKVSRGELVNVAFFGVLLGGMLVKFALFFVLMIVLRSQDWLDPGVAFGTMLVGVLGSLVVDAVVIGRSRIPLDVDLERPGPVATQQGGNTARGSTGTDSESS